MNMPLQHPSLMPISHTLTPHQIEEFGKRIDAIRDAVFKSLNENDAKYIHRIRDFVRYSEITSRTLLMFFGSIPPVWLLSTLLLSLSKIVENMELGHNVMHGQFDWLNDPSLNGNTYDWDSVCSREVWLVTHNFKHHTFTNIIGKDHDIGYGVLRMSDQQEWTAKALFNLPLSMWLLLAFEWGLGFYGLRLGGFIRGDYTWDEIREESQPFFAKVKRQMIKDYVFFPLLSGPMFLPVLAGNFTANILRNMWTASIILCGHLTNHTEMFEDNLESETRAQWYLRQIKGSSNITGNSLLHILCGNLSHQIEHHLFPDMPSNRYAEIAPQVKAVCEEFGQLYNTGSLGRQWGEVFYRIAIHSLPNHMATRVEQTGRNILKRLGLKRLIHA